MSPERWERVKEILEISLELQPGDRPEYLERACAGDPEMRQEVESLIASHEEAGDLLDAPAWEGMDGLLAVEPEPDVTGRRIGPYQIVEEIGHGGMGTVYRCVRADDAFRKEVAIKLVRKGMDSEFILRRFRHERQIMATLDHPNICRLLDGGTTEDGLPYFVMEYIKGKPIDEYCDARGLAVPERLQLFRTVCLAVHCAHQKLIIHRDIKPGNILITADGTPKLLDFGIAKILNPEISTQPLDPTVTFLRMMTPEYASPEQIRGGTISVATDVHAMGVLLYELLTGRRPYRLKDRNKDEIARTICEAAPEKPSTAIARIEEVTRGRGQTRVLLTPEQVSQTRSSQPQKLRRTLAGDLDNIVLMAIRKEPQRRYASVEQLSEDIRRYLDGLPVMARKDTLPYRGVKWLQRHKAGTLSAAVMALLLVSLFAGLLIWSRSERQFKRSASQTSIAPFTSFPGSETQPHFSPDGKKIVFVWGGENNENSDIYVKSLRDESLLRLTTHPAVDVSPVWSPDGRRIAFLRTSQTETAIFVSPAGGGVQEKLADVYPNRLEAVGRHLDWSPDGKFLAVADKSSPEEPFSIFLIAVDTGQKQKLTSPAVRTIGDSNPAFSPDGKSISFLRSPSSGVTDIYVAPLAGPGKGSDARQITRDSRVVLSQTWAPSGRAIVFSSNRTGSFNLWRISASGGAPERVPAIAVNASEPVFSRDGRRLAYSQFFDDANIWRIELAGPTRIRGAPRKLISSTQYDSSAQFSPDGRKIAFRSSRSGNHEIWICDRDGSNAAQLTHFGGPLAGTARWSPDGRWIAFDSRPEGQADIYVIGADGSGLRRLTMETAEDVVPSWSRDGQFVYFASNRTGAWQVWKAPAAGGAKTQVTKNGGFAAFESPDGKTLYYAKGRSLPGLWKVPVAGGEESLVLDLLKPGYWGYWGVTKSGIYFVDTPPVGQQSVINYLRLDSRRIVSVSTIDKPLVVGDSAFAISPDGQEILYTQVDQSGSDIMIAENPAGW